MLTLSSGLSFCLFEDTEVKAQRGRGTWLGPVEAKLSWGFRGLGGRGIIDVSTEAAWGYRQGRCRGLNPPILRGYRSSVVRHSGAAEVALGHQLETRPDPGEAQALHPAGSEAHPQNPGAQRLRSVGPEMEQSGCDLGPGVGGWRLRV